MIRLLAKLLTAVFLLTGVGAATGAEVPLSPPTAAASYLVRVNGAILWSRAAQSRLPQASLAKIMTALLVLEQGKAEELVTVSNTAARETGTRIGLRQGERLRTKDLLAATLLGSANDACRALADHLGAGEFRFVARMNSRAQELGLANTHFNNACGHDHPLQYSTAYDLAVLAEFAMSHRPFAELARTVSLRIETADGLRAFNLENKNELVGRYQGAIGVKTGTTPKAGKCLVALAERGENRVMLVMLKAPERWWQAVAILDRAFAAAAERHSPPDGHTDALFSPRLTGESRPLFNNTGFRVKPGMTKEGSDDFYEFVKSNDQ
ncbi:MAG: D-alanyl-D-alanine carboxypeptidase [Deltaproteobacteria bacterium]|nr:D-alanyl-D-alanine carboxypeptidase [Deltaproteobacteria bacterium]